MKFNAKNPREFWRKISKVTKQESNVDIPIPPEELRSYYKVLLDTTNIDYNVNPVTSLVETDEALDQPIEEQEIRVAIKALKTNKAPGLDGLPPVIFKSFNNQLISFIAALFNKLLEQETYPDVWCTGIIKPIYKKSDARNPNNYRGVTLLPVLGKLSHQLLDRLLYWAELNNKLNEAQFGFRKGRRTSHPIFILSTTIQSYKNKHKPIYACFVDLAKAFDSIKHDLLWNKLAAMGVSKKIINLLYTIHVSKGFLQSHGKQYSLFIFSL